jgi:hypothetical protein
MMMSRRHRVVLFTTSPLALQNPTIALALALTLALSLHHILHVPPWVSMSLLLVSERTGALLKVRVLLLEILNSM